MNARLATVSTAAAVLVLTPLLTASAQAADILLSQGRQVVSSTMRDASSGAGNAVDGNAATSWRSADRPDPQWIRMDLGQRAAVHRVRLTWGAGPAAAYRVEVSDDGSQWRQASLVTDGDGGVDDLTGLSAHGRFVRVVDLAPGTGHPLGELAVYGIPDSTGDGTAPTAGTGSVSSQAGAITATTAGLSWAEATDDVGVTGYDVLRDGKVIATTTTPAYTDTGLTPGTAYRYTVRARDAAGNTSSSAGELKVTTPQGKAGTYVLAAAGDIAAQCTASDSKCVHPKTAAQVGAMNPNAVITMGDNQYDDAHIEDFQKYFDKTWGRFKDIMHPVPGNHETYDHTPLGAYKKYFGKIATPQGKTYYSWELGNWHFVALDSTQFDKEFTAGKSEQLDWLKQDLAANKKGCVAAYYHHPRFSSGDHGDNRTVADIWSTLVKGKVDLVLNGHDHHYERFAPQNVDGRKDPNGPVQIIGGTGGMDLYPVHAEHPSTEKLLSAFGVLRLDLTDTGFATKLLGTDGSTLDSSPAYTCH
ncbi:discoidin domain-containing protein [Amycolatopsis minnesotensis]|uniref:Discoidin domain-containing protein n=1 Tax=Amycolatopsis minnesotensis TaxID=337894 RepID=A0ABN2RR26_9PSEU